MARAAPPVPRPAHEDDAGELTYGSFIWKHPRNADPAPDLAIQTVNRVR